MLWIFISLLLKDADIQLIVGWQVCVWMCASVCVNVHAFVKLYACVGVHTHDWMLCYVLLQQCVCVCVCFIKKVLVSLGLHHVTLLHMQFSF